MISRKIAMPTLWAFIAMLGWAVPGWAASLHFQQTVIASKPLLYYKLNEASGNAKNYGSLGSGFDAVYNGTVIRDVPTKYGDQGVGFDDAGDYLESLSPAPAQLTGNPAFTAEAIVYLPNGGSATLWPPFLHWGSGGTGKEVFFSLQNSRINVLYAGFYNAGLRTVDPVPLGLWLHVVWVRQGGGDSQTGTTLYVNGTPVALEPDSDLCCNPLTPNVTSTVFRIDRGADFTRWFDGDMDEIALYDRAFNPGEVAAHYQVFLEMPGDLNCDDTVDGADIDPFFLALADPAAYAAQFPGCPTTNGDINGDGSVDGADIDAFFKLLGG